MVLFFFSGGDSGLRASEIINVPYEIKFADISFQLNDATRLLLQQEIAVLEKNDAELKKNLQLASIYLPETEQILRDASVPDDFKYLAIYNKFQRTVEYSELLESGVYWCMDYGKSIDVDLRINEFIDERKHFFLSSDAAIISLKRNKVLYNNWGTVLFAHLASREVINLLEINRKWSGKQFILLDSPAYSSLIQYLAFKYAIEKSFPGYRAEVQEIIYKYPYGDQKSLNVIAADLRVNPLELKSTNQWLKSERLLNSDIPVVVIVPASRYHDIRILAEMSRNSTSSQTELGFPVLINAPSLSKGKGGVFYQINGKEGIKADMCDNAVMLSYKTGVPLKSFLKYNNLTEKDVLSIGMIYYLQAKDSKGPIALHVVREGETLWDISQLYGVDLNQLLKFNRLKSVQRLQRGRIVYLQKKRPKKQAIEYIESPIQNPENEILNNDPILSERSSFGQEKVVKTEAGKKEVDIVTITPKQIQDTTILISNNPDKGKKEENKLVTKEIKVSKINPENSYTDEIREVVLNEKKPEQKPEKSFIVHTVKKGETLYRISVNYKVSLDQLYKLNKLSSNIIEIGDQIKVKAL